MYKYCNKEETFGLKLLFWSVAGFKGVLALFQLETTKAVEDQLSLG